MRARARRRLCGRLCLLDGCEVVGRWLGDECARLALECVRLPVLHPWLATWRRAARFSAGDIGVEGLLARPGGLWRFAVLNGVRELHGIIIYPCY